MYVGVILGIAIWIDIASSIPHVCGGDPNAFTAFTYS